MYLGKKYCNWLGRGDAPVLTGSRLVSCTTRGSESRSIYGREPFLKRTLFSLILAGLLSMSVMGALAAHTTVVTEADVTRAVENTPPTDNWMLYTRALTPGIGVFRVGPGEVPLGVGSLELTTTGGSDKVFLFNFDHIGTKLTDINTMSYETYRSAGSAQQVTALNMVIDENGGSLEPGDFSTLVFEPVYNTDQGSVVSGEWQDWTAAGSGVWWSTQPINGQCAGATSACDKTWNEIQANNPDATILGGFGVNQGGGNAGLMAAVDALTINTVTYDFEPYRVAANADDCKNGGWMNAKRADGSSFKNQGDCIQFVNTGK